MPSLLLQPRHRALRPAALALLPALLGVGAADACTLPGFQPAALSVAEVTPQGDLRLGDGGLARLAGVRLGAGEAGDLSRALAAMPAPELWLDPLAPPDRWGRRAVALGSHQQGSATALTEFLLTKGVGLTFVAELPQDCRVLFLRAEARARGEGLGRWARPEGRLLDAADGAAVAAAAGTFAVMAGRVSHVGQTRRAVYLNFGPRGRGASVELTLSAWRELEARGWTRTRLRGQNIRARGVVFEASPARMLVEAAAAIETDD